MSVSIHNISDEQLATQLKQLSKKERECTHQIIVRLAEMDRRRLYAPLGYSSLHDFAVRALGYSAAAAQRRIKAARAIKLVPEAFECLQDGTLTLGVLEVISDAMRSDNAREMIRDVQGKTKQEALEVVAHYHPVVAGKLFDTIEPVLIQKITSLRAEPSKIIDNELQYRVSFTADGELKEKLERAKELVYSSCGDDSLENVLGRALDEYLNKHCPKQRQAKRERKEAAKAERIVSAVDQVRQAANEIAEKLPARVKPSRYIPRALRDEVLARDGYCCTYKAPDGTRCESTKGLEVDHVHPLAVGGATVLPNLRTACRAHNFLYARQIFGEEYIESIIAKRDDGGEMCFHDTAERMVYGVP